KKSTGSKSTESAKIVKTPVEEKLAKSTKIVKTPTEEKLVKPLLEKQIESKRVLVLPIDKPIEPKSIIIFAHGCRIPWTKENVFAKSIQPNKYTALNMSDKNSYLNMLIKKEPVVIDMDEFLKYFKNEQDPHVEWGTYPVDEYRTAYYGSIGDTILK